MPLLEISHLKKEFSGNLVLKDVAFSLDHGEVIVIIGPSGSGKTTFLRNLNFLERADSGEMTFSGKKINLAKPLKTDILWVRRHTAMVFQNYNLFKNKTALENVEEGLIFGQGKSRNEARELAMEALSSVNMTGKKDYYPSQLSGGQQQRIGIARATALHPDIILFDEPTSALDPELVGGVIADMKNLAQAGQTMIVVTHLMSFAQTVASRVVFFADGQIVESGTPEEVFEDPKHDRTKMFLSAISKDR